MKPADITALREKHQLNKVEFARLVYTTAQSVHLWEAGRRAMPLASWELALIKLENIEPKIPKTDNELQQELKL